MNATERWHNGSERPKRTSYGKRPTIYLIELDYKYFDIGYWNHEDGWDSFHIQGTVTAWTKIYKRKTRKDHMPVGDRG
jgi:hypothetical protein